jgi:hypothetical protein
MRLLAWLFLTALPIGIVSQLPDPAELEAPMTAQAEQGRIELERLWADTGTLTSTTANNDSSTTVALPTGTTTTTTTTTTLPDVRCVEWWHAAATAGWPAERIPVLLDSIIWAESRCLPDVTNGHDDGLTQINWSTWSQLVTDIGLQRQHLMQPELNLRVALMVAQAAENHGWRWCQPWDSSGNHC